MSCADDEAAISPDRSNAISPEKPLHQIHNGIPSQLGMQAIPGLQGMQAHALQNQAQAAAHIPGLMPMQSSSIPGLQNYHPGLLSQQQVYWFQSLWRKPSSKMFLIFLPRLTLSNCCFLALTAVMLHSFELFHSMLNRCLSNTLLLYQTISLVYQTIDVI